jgi:putative aldouronate transport system substrate-binding protein
MKRIGLISVMLIMACGLLVAAGQDGTASESTKAGMTPSGFPIFNEKVTLSMFGPKSEIEAQWKDMIFFKKMEEMTNIAFEFETPGSAAFQERMSVRMAGGDLPDIFMRAGFSPQDQLQFGSRGAFLPLEDIIDKYNPAFKKLMDSNAQIIKQITSADGHIYALPDINEISFDLTEKTWIRTEWLDALGLEMPTTTDELYTVLMAFKEGDPNGNGTADEIPLTVAGGTGGLKHYMLEAFGIRYLNGFPPFHADADNQLSYIYATDAYLAYLKFMNKLYEEELLDNNLFTNTGQELTAIGREQRLGMYPHAAAFIYNVYDNNELFEGAVPLTSEYNDTPFWPRKSGVNPGQMALSTTNPYPEASMRWADYFYTIEGSQLIDQGVEGISWDWTDDTRTFWRKTLPEGMTDTTEWRAQNTLRGGPRARLTYWIGKLNSPHAIELAEETGEKWLPIFEFVVPKLILEEADQKKAAVINADLELYAERMEAEFITGETDFSEWSEYISTLNKIDIEELTAIYQKAFDRYNKF